MAHTLVLTCSYKRQQALLRLQNEVYQGYILEHSFGGEFHDDLFVKLRKNTIGIANKRFIIYKRTLLKR